MDRKRPEIEQISVSGIPLADIELLNHYCLERGLCTDEGVTGNTFLLCNKLRTEGALTESEQKQLVDYYCKLEIASRPVNARTLHASRPLAIADYATTGTGRYLVALWTIALLVSPVIFILQPDIIDNLEALTEDESTLIWLTYRKLSEYLLPFLYGTLGSCVYLLRKTEQLLHKRTFDPSRLPEHWNRLVLGTLSGGVASMFIQDGDLGMGLAEGTVGFLAGYSVNMLFAAIDRTLTAILPRERRGVLDEKELEKLREQYRKQRREVHTKEAQTLIEKIIRDLKQS